MDEKGKNLTKLEWKIGWDKDILKQKEWVYYSENLTVKLLKMFSEIAIIIQYSFLLLLLP